MGRFNAMDAQICWNVWRRILREPPLSNAIVAIDSQEALNGFGLTDEEREIANAYRATPKQTAWFVTNYRYRLVSSYCFALETCAPFVWRLLRSHEIDMRSLVTQYLDRFGWRDTGPMVYTTCRILLDFVLKNLGNEIAYLQDVVKFDNASVMLISSLAGVDESTWPNTTQRQQIEQTKLNADFQRTGTGVVQTVDYDITPWLKDKSAIGKLPLRRNVQHYLIYLPSASAAFKIARLNDIGKRVFESLAEIATVDELLAHEEIRQASVQRTELQSIIGHFLRLGVVRSDLRCRNISD